MTAFIDTASLIEWGGLLLILAMVYAETGLLLGLLIPAGETLLFTAGVLASTGFIEINVYLLASLLILSGFAGDLTGFFIGRKAGEKIYERDKWYLKKKYLRIAEKIILKNKYSAIVFGKFLPVVRPFVPAITGTTKMGTARFTWLTVLSCLLFMSVFVFSGYFLGLKFPGIKNYIAWLLPISIIIAIAAVFVQVKKYKSDPGN